MDKKKISAALAAVSMYIKTQEEAVAFPEPEIKEPEADVTIITQPPAQTFNGWGILGRQTQMQANSMMQLRMFKS
ncbi:MAG: hypothetical protein WC836_12025 [Desulfobacula sp.]|jgi:hypothetical protein